MFWQVLRWNSRLTRPKKRFLKTTGLSHTFSLKIDDLCVWPWNKILHHHMNVLNFFFKFEEFLNNHTLLWPLALKLIITLKWFFLKKIWSLKRSFMKNKKINKSANSVDVRRVVNTILAIASYPTMMKNEKICL